MVNVVSLALFEPGDLRFDVERDRSMDPSISETTEKAIQILKKNPKDSSCWSKVIILTTNQSINQITNQPTNKQTNYCWSVRPSIHKSDKSINKPGPYS